MQYASWIGDLLHGDLGYSYVSEKPAIAEIAPRLPVTAELAALSLVFSILSRRSARRHQRGAAQHGIADYLLRVVSLSGLSMPAFWLGLLILMALVAWSGSCPDFTEPPANFGSGLLRYCIPATAVGFRSSALIMRLTRSSMLEVLRQDYIRNAHARKA